jgi:LPXTG-motif cell wall-anchored protein
MRKKTLPLFVATGAIFALTGVVTTPAAQAASPDNPSFVSGPELDSRVIFQDFSFFQPYESDTYVTLAAKAESIAALGITDVWMAPPYRALNAYNEEGYAITDRYDLGQYPAGHNGETATKYGTSDELKAAINAFHAVGVNVQADIVPNQMYLYQDREVVPVTAVNQYGNLLPETGVTNKLYEVYSKGGGAGQAEHGTFPQWNSSHLNGLEPQYLGTDRVLLHEDGSPYRYFGEDDPRNSLPDWLAESEAQNTGELNNINSYLTVDGYYAVSGAGTGSPVYRPLLLGYEEFQDGAVTTSYLDFMRTQGFEGTDDEVRAAIIAAPDQTIVDRTNDYIGAQPGYSRTSEAGISALRFDNNDVNHVNQNLLQYEFLLGPDIDNTSPVVQAEHLNWQKYLIDEYDFDGFRWDAAGHYNKALLEQSADYFTERFGDDQINHLNFIESYVDQQVDFLNDSGNGQLAYDDELHYAYLNSLGKANPDQALSTVLTNSLVDRSNGSTSTAIPNWSFVTNHDTEHTATGGFTPTTEQAGGNAYGTRQYQLAQYELYAADREKVEKTRAPHNVPSSYALALTNKDTVPTVFYGDMWDSADSYMATETPYYDEITALLNARETNASGEQLIASYPSNLSSTPGQDLVSSVRTGSDRQTGIAVVVGNKADLDTTIEVDMGASHGDQQYVDALGYHSETLTTDENGILTVNVIGTQTVDIKGYLGVWVPKAELATSTVELTIDDSSLNAGQITNLTAKVSSAHADATGTVTFLDGETVIGTAAVSGNTATFTTPATLTEGEYSLTAAYSGDENIAASTSAPSTLTVVTEVVPSDPETSTPVDPKPTTPVDPEPVDPKPTTPVVPEPTTPADPKPTTPVSPEPVDPKPTTPVSPEPVDPKPTTPVVPEPTTPVVPEPTTPADPKPTTPVVPEPTTPADPKPTTPVVPEPTTPVVTDPITGDIIDPTAPIVTDPTKPVVTIPTTPADTDPPVTDPTGEPDNSDASSGTTGSETPAPDADATSTKLASTGTDVAPIVAISALLLLIGAGALVLVRRRRSSER